MEPRFEDFNLLTGEGTPVRRVRLIGDGWHIEVTPTEDGIQIMGSGNMSGSDALMVFPLAANVVRITNNIQHEQAARQYANRLIEVDKANKQFWKGKKPKK